MPDTFDPYHHWLGIRPEEHPVDHYRLLGLTRFEADGDVIASACDRLMSHVRKFQTGPRGTHTQEVLTRLAAARACLLNAGAKSTYDAVLQGQMAAAASAQARRAAPMASAYEPGMSVMAPPPPPPPMMTSAPSAPLIDFAAPPTKQQLAPQSQELQPVAEASPFYVQPWFPVAIVAGVILVALSVWGIGTMIGAARKKAAQTPVVKNHMEIDVPLASTEPEDSEPPDETVYILPEAGGALNFTARTAQLAGGSRLVEQNRQIVVSGITSVEDRLRWNFRLGKPGPFRIEATYAAPPGSEGGTFTLTVGEQTTKAITVRNTGGDTFTSERIGFLWVRRAGKHELVLTPVSLVAEHSLMTLESLRFVPVGGAGE